jgi:hypothetical protein
MTSEKREKSCRAVRCFYCSEPNRLSIRRLELCKVHSDNTSAKLDCHCSVFILRCDACSRESRYLKAKIDTFGIVPPNQSA